MFYLQVCGELQSEGLQDQVTEDSSTEKSSIVFSENCTTADFQGGEEIGNVKNSKMSFKRPDIFLNNINSFDDKDDI